MNTFARLFALATDEEQAEFLNVAGRMWRRSIGVNGSVAYADIQLSRVADRLDMDGKRLVLDLAQMIDEK